jgi:hypothetical protein
MAKLRKKSSSRLDITTLDAAHKQFVALAGEESRPEIRNALNKAAHITHTLLIVVSVASELGLFLDITIGRRS